MPSAQMGETMRTAVLDIGGTMIKAGVYEDNSLTGVCEYETNASRGGHYVMERAVEILAGFPDIDRIGISTAGQVDSEKGMIRYANSNIPGYTGMEIRSIIESKFKVPAAVENDVNAAAIGEARFGAGRGFCDFLCLTYGTGIGGAIVLDGNVYKGSSFSAGEFGAVVTHAQDRRPDEDIFSGCYERYASVTALVKRAQSIDPALDSGRKIFARLKEAAVRTLVDEWIIEIVYGLTTLMHIFNPSCVVLGGGIMSQPYILTQIRKELDRHIMPSFREVCICRAELGNMAGLLGAAVCAMERMVTG